MKIELGNIYWIEFEGRIPHPHVVIEVNDTSQITVCAITTNRKKIHMPGNILLDIGEGNLEKQSIVDVSDVQNINRSLLGDHIGKLSKKRIDEILNGIGFIKRSFLDRNNS